MNSHLDRFASLTVRRPTMCNSHLKMVVSNEGYIQFQEEQTFDLDKEYVEMGKETVRNIRLDMTYFV